MANITTLKLNLQGDPSSLHPHTGIDLNCRSLQKALFEGLTRISPQGIPEPALALDISLSPSKKIYTFTLREAKWSNGKKVTAHHFEKAWKTALTPGSSCLRADLFYCIKNGELAKKGDVPVSSIGVFAKDENTLVVELVHPTPYFLELVSLPLYAPLYDESVEPICFNGPFILEKWEREKSLVLSKNPLYWDASHVLLDKIAFSLVDDPNTAFLMYENDELDWAGAPFTMLPLDALPNLEETHSLYSVPVAGIYWYSLNTEVFPLNSKWIRKALSCAIDREEIVKNVARETPTASLSSFAQKSLRSDPTKAKEYFELGLKELGLTLETFPPLTLNHSTIAGQKLLAEAVSRSWEETFGIEVHLQASSWNTFFSNLCSKQYQISGCIWYAAYNDPIYTLEFFKEKSHRYNAVSWENSRYRELLELADSETDLGKRDDYLHEAESILLEEAPIIPLYISNHKYLSHDNVKGIYVSPTGLIDFKWGSCTGKTVAAK